jgi:hypothetical protein
VNSLAEIESAAEALPADQQRQLLRFLLRIVPVSDGSQTAVPRLFSDEEIQGWLEEDRETMRRFRESA